MTEFSAVWAYNPFLLRYISDSSLRRQIQRATNKSEAFNKFAQWVLFGGGGIIAENIRDEQRKIIKYNHLIANLLIFHNLVTLDRALKKLKSMATPSMRVPWTI